MPHAGPSQSATRCLHVDIVSFNIYETVPDKTKFDRLYSIVHKPMLIGEYAFDSLDAGLLTTYVPVQNQPERAVGYRYYTETAAALPYLVGCYYFQYIDESVTGRKPDRETSFNGFVSVVVKTRRNMIWLCSRVWPLLTCCGAVQKRSTSLIATVNWLTSNQRRKTI